METSDGGVILPGASSVPLDPENPAKGRITPVLSAADLTAGLMHTAATVDALREGLMGLAAMVRESVAEAAELLENVGVLVTAQVGEATRETFSDAEDEAYESLRAYVEGRQEAKAAAEAEYQAALDAVEGHEVTPTELNDSEAAADDATWD